MVVYSDDIVALLFGLVCVICLLPTHAANYFVDKGNCKCVPYSKTCSMEVVDISMRAFHAKTRACWYGARLCCDKTSSSRPRNGNHNMDYVRGYVFRMDSFPDKNKRQPAPVNKTMDEYGLSNQRAKIHSGQKGQPIPETPVNRSKVPLTTERTPEMKKTQGSTQQHPKFMNRPTDSESINKPVLNIRGRQRLNLQGNAKSSSTSDRIVENTSADKNEKYENNGNTSDKYDTENRSNGSASLSVVKHSSLIVGTVPKDSHSLFSTLTTVPSRTGFESLGLDVPTAEAHYFKGSNLLVKTSNVNAGLLVSEMSKTSSVFLPISLMSVSYGFTTTTIPILSVTDNGKINRMPEVMASIFQSQLTSRFVTTLQTSKHSQVSELPATKSSNLHIGHPSVFVTEVHGAVVKQEISNSSWHTYSSALMSSEKFNSYISLRTTASQVYTSLTQGFSYAKISTQLQVRTPATTVVYPPPKLPSQLILYTLDLTQPFILETSVTTTESQSSTIGFKMFKVTRNSKHLSSPSIVTKAFITASEIYTLTPLQSTKALPPTLLSPAFPSVADAYLYTHNIISQVSQEIPLVTFVSRKFTLAPESHLYNENLSSLTSLEATLITAISTIFITEPKVTSHSYQSTRPAVLKTAFVTAVSPVIKTSSWSLLTQSGRIKSHLFVGNSPAPSVLPRTFPYTQDSTSSVIVRSSSIKSSITLTVSAKGIDTRTRPLISIKIKPASLQVYSDAVFAYQTEDASNAVSPNIEKHRYFNNAHEISSSLITTSIIHFNNAKYEELHHDSKDKTATSLQYPVSRTVANSDYITSGLDYFSHRQAHPLVSHTVSGSHFSSGKYSGYTNLNKQLVSRTKHYIRTTKIPKYHVQKPTQSTLFESQPSSSVNREGSLYSHLTRSVIPAVFPRVTETGKYSSNTAKLIADHNIYDTSSVVLVGARNRDLIPSKSLAVDYASALKRPKMQVSKSLNLGNSGLPGTTTANSDNQDPPGIYIKPSSEAEKDFREFLQSVLEERLNKSKTDTNGRSGVWNWLFG